MNGEAICRNCGTEIEFVSQRPDEGWEKQWRHLPSGVEVVGPRRCPIYAEPVEGIGGYCTCHPDQAWHCMRAAKKAGIPVIDYAERDQ